MKYHTPRATTAAMAMTFIDESPVINRAVHFTLYTFTKVCKTVRSKDIA